MNTEEMKLFLCYNLALIGLNLQLVSSLLTSRIPSNDAVEKLSSAAGVVVERVFMDRTKTVNLISAVESSNGELVQDFKSALLSAGGGFNIYRQENHSIISTSREREANSIILDTLRSFEMLTNKITPENFNYRGFFLFVLLNGRFEGYEEMFKSMWQKKIVHVNFLYVEDKIVKVETFMPFGVSSCNTTSPVLINNFINETFTHGIENFFPKKLKNLFDCPINVTTFDRCPAVCRDEHSGTLSGFDIDLIKATSKALNFSINPTFLHGLAQWGTILPNGSTTGAIRAIVTKNAQLIFGNFMLRGSRLPIMDHSVPYFSNPLMFMIPPSKRFTHFEKLLQPFDETVWILLLLVVLFALLVTLMLTLKFKKLQPYVYGSGMRDPVMNALVGIFGGSQLKLPKENFSRVLLMMFLILCLVMRSAYQGSLYKFLQSDRHHKELQSVDEMIERNFEFYMQGTQLDIIQNNPKIYDR